MSTAQLPAVSHLARYPGRTHPSYAYQLREWFTWCESHGLNPLIGVNEATSSSTSATSASDRGDGLVGRHDDAHRAGYFRFAHIDGLISSDPALYARLSKMYRDESRTHGLDPLELIRFLQVAQMPVAGWHSARSDGGGRN